MKVFKRLEFSQRDQAVLVSQLRQYCVTDPERERRRLQLLNVLEIHLRKSWRMVKAENKLNGIGDGMGW